MQIMHQMPEVAFWEAAGQEQGKIDALLICPGELNRANKMRTRNSYRPRPIMHSPDAEDNHEPRKIMGSSMA